MRIGKSLAVFGMVLIVISFINLGGFGSGSFVGPGQYDGEWIRTGGDFYLSVEPDIQGDVVSIFVLNFDDTLKVINSASTVNTSPIFETHNVTGYVGRIQIIFPGLYSILVTSFANETGYSMDFELILPALPITISGIGLLSTGLIVLFIKKNRQVKKY